MSTSVYSRQGFMHQKQTNKPKKQFGKATTQSVGSKLRDKLMGRTGTNRYNSKTILQGRLNTTKLSLSGARKSVQSLPRQQQRANVSVAHEMTPTSIEYDSGASNQDNYMSQLSFGECSFHSHASYPRLGQDSQSVASGKSRGQTLAATRGGQSMATASRGPMTVRKKSLSCQPNMAATRRMGRVPHGGRVVGRQQLSQGSGGQLLVQRRHSTNRSVTSGQSIHSGSVCRPSRASQRNSRVQYNPTQQPHPSQTHNLETQYAPQRVQTQFQEHQGDSANGTMLTVGQMVQKVEAAVLQKLDPNVDALNRRKVDLEQQQQSFYTRIQTAEDQQEESVQKILGATQDALAEFQTAKQEVLDAIQQQSNEEDKKHRARKKDLGKMSSEISAKAYQASKLYDSMVQLAEQTASKVTSSVQGAAVNVVKAILPSAAYEKLDRKSSKRQKRAAVTPKAKEISRRSSPPTKKKKRPAPDGNGSPFKPLSFLPSKKKRRSESSLRTPPPVSTFVVTTSSPKKKRSSRRTFGTSKPTKQSSQSTFDDYDDDDFAFTQ